MASSSEEIIVRALHTLQGNGLDVYAFFINGPDVMRVADITRLERDQADNLKGRQPQRLSAPGDPEPCEGHRRILAPGRCAVS
ncbi:hypothetical protein [Acidithiobacillus sp. MC2.2]|uniref:hypothetical protein n=1 Tax=Acidithiobacillus sp. MC2.2 TaxID=2801579 RepID=UPI0027DC6A8F|nr:hypothetical protein [Acidithiobacillus sp. MC2.2]